MLTRSHFLSVAIVIGCAAAASHTVELHAQGNFIDDFSDGDHTDGNPVTWEPGGFPAGTRDSSSGDLVLIPNDAGDGMTASIDEVYGDASIHTVIRTEDTDFFSVGIFARSRESGTYTASIDSTGAVLLEFFTNDFEDIDFVSTDLDVSEQDVHLQFDMFGELLTVTAWADGDPKPEPQIEFDDDRLEEGTIGVFLNGNGGLSSAAFRFFEVITEATLPGDFNGNSLLDVEDINLLVGEVASGGGGLEFDLTDDGAVDQEDVRVWVKDLANTWYGDVDLDGEFNSGDLVSVFTAGEYEDATANNSVWSTGDWNADGDFSSSDLVTAFTDGGYENGPRPQAVPEPSGLFLLLGGIALSLGRRSAS